MEVSQDDCHRQGDADGRQRKPSEKAARCCQLGGLLVMNYIRRHVRSLLSSALLARQECSAAGALLFECLCSPPDPHQKLQQRSQSHSLTDSQNSAAPSGSTGAKTARYRSARQMLCTAQQNLPGLLCWSKARPSRSRHCLTTAIARSKFM